MRRLILTTALALAALLLLVPPAWAAWIWPLQGELITPYRNGDDPYAGGQHRGIDIAGDTGAPVVAAAGGEVRFAAIAGSSGLTVSVRTADGRYDTSYLHLGSTAVRKGDQVNAGDRIGSVGTTGSRSADRPHLHFGVRDAGERHAYHDPLDFLGAPTPPADRPADSPAPEPAPVPVVPAPEPVRVPAGDRVPAGRRAPARRRVPAGRRVPARRRIPAGRRVPARRRVPAGRHVPAGQPAPVPKPVPVGNRAPARGHAPADNELPRDGRARSGHQLDRRAPAGMSGADRVGTGTHADSGAPANSSPATPAPGTPPRTSGHPGPDLGLVLACLGLLVAAALLGLSKDGHAAGDRTQGRMAGLLRPLHGGRR